MKSNISVIYFLFLFLESGLSLALFLRKYRLTFFDGSTETIETIGLWLAWFKGKIRAREKDTVLVKVERV